MMKRFIFILTLMLLLVPYIKASAMEPSTYSPHIATCGASTFVLKADNSLWFFGRDVYGNSSNLSDKTYLTPVKVMDNVKKVSLANLATTKGAYMPTCLILTYNNDLYIGGFCRYCPFNISENISLVHPEKIWDDVRDMDIAGYRIIENDGDMHVFVLGEAQEVENVGNQTCEDINPVFRTAQENWVNEYFGNLNDMAEYDTLLGFYVGVKNDGSVWTAIDSSEFAENSHGYILGDGTEEFQSYNRKIRVEPVQIFPAGTCIKNISVYVNDALLNFDVQPRIINDRTMVPLRAIFEALGASVEWDADTQTILSDKDGVGIKMTIGTPGMYINGTAAALDSPPCIVDGRTLVPVRAISEAFGCEVGWDNASMSVLIKE